jgi:predicted ribosome quality control (RQC) complex YloA/Tae2 family protein
MLSLELSGRHANAFLLDDGGAILGSFFPTHSLTRPLSTGAIYTLPPSAVAGTAAHGGTSRFPAEETGAAVDAFFTAAQTAAARDRARAAAIAARTRELEKARKVLEHLRTDALRMERRTEGRRLGDLFLAALPTWPAGATSYTFTPYDGAPPETLTLPIRCKTPAAAAQLHFAEYKKARRSRAVIEERAAHFAARVAQLEAEREALEQRPPEFFDTPVADDGRSGRGGKSTGGVRTSGGSKKSKQPATEAGIRAFVSSDGLPIQVGKSATDNHRLTFQKARGADVWLHARDVPGSHTVIFCGNAPVPRRTLEEAAMLALFYSDARPEGRGDVHWVQRKFVHAVRGAPGKVTLAAPKSIFVIIDPAVIERLFAGRPDTR